MQPSRTVRSISISALVVGLLAPAMASAQTAPPPRHEGTAEAAFVGTSGNASTSTFSAGGAYIARPVNWVIRNQALAVRGTAESVTTAESFLYGFRAERVLNPRLSAFGDYGFFRDKPAGISARNTIAGGLAIKVLTTSRQTLTADAGLGYFNESRLTGGDVSSAIYVAGTVYKLKLSDTAELADELRLLGTFDRGEDWRATHAIAVTARLTTLLSLKVSNMLRFANVPPPGFKKTDTTTAVALVASFKKP